jgi:hypothetical protein
MNEKTDDAPPAFEDATEATAEAHSPGRDTLVATLARISAETARLEAAHTRAKDEIRQFEERLRQQFAEENRRARRRFLLWLGIVLLAEAVLLVGLFIIFMPKWF